MNKKQKVKGIILVISCHKHLFSRLHEFGPKQDEYNLNTNGNDSLNKWIVHKIIGNPLQQEKYIIDSNTGIITMKCEDSYIHVMKKVVMAMELMFELYEIEEGILRCGDDLIFNEHILQAFLKLKVKGAYLGNRVGSLPTELTKKKYDPFMVNYYLKNKQDFTHFLHGLKDKESLILEKCNEIPICYYAGGVVFYVSKLSCSILISHMKSIDYNIFTYHHHYGYPYIIEDIGVGFVLMKNNIQLSPMYLYSDISSYQTIAYHTNKYK